MKKSVIILFLLFGVISISAMADTFPEVRIPNTEERALHSAIMDYEYGIYVALPGGYKSNPDKVYPAVYIIDGESYYIYAHQPKGSLMWGNMIKDHITVSVAYRPGQKNWRSRDFRTSERAADFLSFFREELIPFVESNYRTSKVDRTLFGHSLGGQFTLYTLLTTQTELFEKFIACAPAVNDDIMNLEKQYAASHADFPVTLFLASGVDDHLTIGAKRFVAQFESRQYPSLIFDKLYVPNGNHGTIQPSAYIEGLRFVLDPTIDLAPEKYKRLEGDYTEGGNTYTLRYDGGNNLRFFGVPESYDAPLVEWQKLYPVSETSFVSKGWPGTFEFGGDLSKPAATFSFSSRGETVTARRK